MREIGLPSVPVESSSGQKRRRVDEPTGAARPPPPPPAPAPRQVLPSPPASHSPQPPPPPLNAPPNIAAMNKEERGKVWQRFCRVSRPEGEQPTASSSRARPLEPPAQRRTSHSPTTIYVLVSILAALLLRPRSFDASIVGSACVSSASPPGSVAARGRRDLFQVRDRRRVSLVLQPDQLADERSR